MPIAAMTRIPFTAPCSPRRSSRSPHPPIPATPSPRHRVEPREFPGEAAVAGASEGRAGEGVRRCSTTRAAQFTDRDLYVVVYDMKGKVLAHGANEKMIGKDVIELRDNDGKYFVKERVEMMSKGPDAKGWQDYKFMNPVTRQIEPKSMYLQRHEDMIVGTGIYK